MTSVLRTTALSFAHPGNTRKVLDAITLSINSGEFVALVGQNGSGKSTLLQLLSGTIKPSVGVVHLRPPGEEEAPLRAFSRRTIARNVAMMHQTLPPIPGLLVRQLVQQGSFPRKGALGMLATADGNEVEDALAVVGLEGWGDRGLDELSGGERQRVRLALALAQQAPILLLDEPTAHLDVHHQLSILELVSRLQRERGLTVIVVLHDLDHAARFADRVVALAGGTVHADGAPESVVTTKLLADVFAVEGRVVRDQGRLRAIIDAPIPSIS